MSVEYGSQAQHQEVPLRKTVGGAMELAAAVGTPAEMIVTGLVFWPLAIGGAIFLIGMGLRRGGKKAGGASH